MLLSLNFFITTGNSTYVLPIFDTQEQHTLIHMAGVTGAAVNGRGSKILIYSAVSKKTLPNFLKASS
jgi:hypothetical protein